MYKTYPVKVGNLLIGGGHPVSVQTMWKYPLNKVDNSLVAAIDTLFGNGCDFLRFAVPDLETAHLLGNLAGKTPHPLVADVHFDYKIALACMDYPVAKLRINPGNIGSSWKVEEVLKKATDMQIPIRVGVNHGSLPKSLQNEPEPAIAMLKAAELEMEILEKLGFSRVIFSLKSSQIETTLQAYRLFAEKYAYPLHLGVTEAGPLIQGVVKSTIACYTLLKEGIGDTLRISLSDSSLNEIITGRQIINAMQKQKQGADIISCPTCGRSTFDVKGFLEKVQMHLIKIKKPVTIAIMGCPVNGPGEARQADLGITGSAKSVILFKKGKIIDKLSEEDSLACFIKELDRL